MFHPTRPPGWSSKNAIFCLSYKYKVKWTAIVQDIRSRTIHIGDTLSLKQDRKNQSINEPEQVLNYKVGKGRVKGFFSPPKELPSN